MRLAILIALAPLPALADALAERFVEAHRGQGEAMRAMFEICAPALASEFPDAIMTPALEEAALCLLERHREAGTAEAAVAEMESLAAGRYESMMQLSAALGPVLSSEAHQDHARACRFAEVSQAAPATAFVQRNVQGLIACFQ